MDRYLLHISWLVFELGSFSKAAQRVSVTQPTLSVGIAKLEDRVGARLFERTTQRVSLTRPTANSTATRPADRAEYGRRCARSRSATTSKRLRGILPPSQRDLERVVAAHARNSAARALEILDSTERDIANRLSDEASM